MQINNAAGTNPDLMAGTNGPLQYPAISIPITTSVALTTGQQLNTLYTFTGALTGDATITFSYAALTGSAIFILVRNKTTGGHNLILAPNAGSGAATLVNGDNGWFAWDGTNFERVSQQSP